MAPEHRSGAFSVVSQMITGNLPLARLDDYENVGV
jgi:hypothetical protein